MVLVGMKVLRILILLTTIVMFSCENTLIKNCEDCLPDEPLEAVLRIKLSASMYSTNTEIRIYEGDIEDNILFFSFNTNNNESTFSVPINKKYTLTATYRKSNGTYIAVDSAFPRVGFNKNQCEDPCYLVYGNSVNLKLKY